MLLFVHPELEHFVLALYHDLQNGGPLGSLLEMGLHGQELQRERVGVIGSLAFP